MSTFIVVVTLIHFLHGSDLENIYCNSNTSSTLTSTTEDDFLLNLSPISSEFNNSDIIDVELIIFPLIHIEIYFINTSIYHICTEKVCYLERMPIMKHFILRMNKYLHISKVINYTLSIKCHLSHTTSTTDVWSVDSLSFSQNLSFANRANILCFAASVFVVILFIFVGLIAHRNSKRKELQFIAKKSNYWFYVCSLLTLSCSIIMCATKYYDDKAFLGILVVLNMSTINLVSVVGIKYYQGCIHNKTIKTCTLAQLTRYLSMLIAIGYAISYYICIYQYNVSLVFISFILTLVELLVLSIMSLASKTAQIQWLLLFLLIGWIFDSEYEEIVFDFYWYSIFCITCAILTVFLFAPKKYVSALRSDFINIFGSFLSVFDIATDIMLIITWVSKKYYFWVVMQLVFIFSGTAYSALYIDQYYLIGDADSYELQSKSPMNEKKKKNIENIKTKRFFWGRIFTLFGVGRVYHGVMGWDKDNKDMEISNRVLKVWEMIFESFPTIVLQTWISLYTDLNVNIVLSLFVGFASISFTFFRVLYGDHHSDEGEDEKLQIAHQVLRVHKPTQSSFDYGSNIHVMMKQIEKKPKPISNDVSTIKEEKSNNIQETKPIIQSFICCIPFTLLRDYYLNKKKNKDNNSSAKTCFVLKDFFISDKLFYFALYLWISMDSFLRIFPILAFARLREEYLEFLLIMFGLSLFEFGMYYFMLVGEFKTPRIVIKSFWTLYMTISYCLLSTMYLIYLPNNVIFKRLIIEHTIRMLIQCAFIVAVLFIQLDQYGNALGFFDKSIYVCVCIFVMDAMLTCYIYRRMKSIEDKIKIHFSSLNVYCVSNDSPNVEEAIELASI